MVLFALVRVRLRGRRSKRERGGERGESEKVQINRRVEKEDLTNSQIEYSLTFIFMRQKRGREEE